MLWLRPKLRLFLEWLCVGMLWFGFQAPQALLLYVLSSASFALAQGSGPGRYVTRAALGPLFGLPPVGQQTALARDSKPQQPVNYAHQLLSSRRISFALAKH
jgi:hypothetical protein